MNSDFHKALGRRIQCLRKLHQFTQAELAQALGLSQQSVFAIEEGDRRVSVDRVPALAATFGVSADELLGIKPLAAGAVSPVSARLVRHVEEMRQLSVRDQRFIIRLAGVLVPK